VRQPRISNTHLTGLVPRVSFQWAASLVHPSAKEQNAEPKILSRNPDDCTGAGDELAGRCSIAGNESIISGSPCSNGARAGTNQNSAQSQANDDNPLNLSDDQKAKLRPIIQDENQQMEALRSDNSLTQEQKIDKANQIRAAASPKIKAILTPEQLQKLAQLQQERVREQQQQTQPAPSNSQPPPK
jgi:Spy/CpxP family protein refolding chaperone